MNENLPEAQAPPWYFRTSTLIIGFLFIGPFILPVVWINPQYTVKKKTILTLVILALSAFLMKIVLTSFKSICEYYKLMNF